MPSIELAYHSVLGELHKLTLTLFVKKFSILAQKNFQKENLRMSAFDLKRTLNL